MNNHSNNDVINYTYIVKCADGSLYTGWTNHIEERIRAHNEGRGAKYTRSRRPVELVYLKTFETKEQAMSCEYRIKKLTRKQKMALIESGSETSALPQDLPEILRSAAFTGDFSAPGTPGRPAGRPH